MVADDFASEVEESLIVLHRMIGLAIHHGERSRVDVLFLIEARDEFVERAKVGVMFRGLERIDNDRMNLALPWSAGLFVRCATVR